MSGTELNHRGLVKAMDLAGVSKTRLAEEIHVSLGYVCDLTTGRRTLRRNPELRRAIATALDVPRAWIEQDIDDATRGAA